MAIIKNTKKHKTFKASKKKATFDPQVWQYKGKLQLPKNWLADAPENERENIINSLKEVRLFLEGMLAGNTGRFPINYGHISNIGAAINKVSKSKDTD